EVEHAYPETLAHRRGAASGSPLRGWRQGLRSAASMSRKASRNPRVPASAVAPAGEAVSRCWFPITTLLVLRPRRAVAHPTLSPADAVLRGPRLVGQGVQRR